MPGTPDHAARRRGLGRAIQVLRVERGMSRSELAKKAGVSYSHLAEIENGRKEPSPARFGELAAALGLGRTELVSLQEAYAEGREPMAAEATGRRLPSPVRGRSFVMPLRGEEWEAVPPGAPSAPRPPEPSPEERRALIGDLVDALQGLSTEDLRRLLDFARGLSAG